MTAPDRVHLWEVKHDYYGGAEEPERLESLEEMAQTLANNGYDGANFAYRWDWIVPDPRWSDPAEPEVFQVTFISPRKGHLWGLEVAVTRDQEPEVLALIQGHLVPWIRQMWAPVLDEVQP